MHSSKRIHVLASSFTLAALMFLGTAWNVYGVQGASILESAIRPFQAGAPAQVVPPRTRKELILRESLRSSESVTADSASNTHPSASSVEDEELLQQTLDILSRKVAKLRRSIENVSSVDGTPAAKAQQEKKTARLQALLDMVLSQIDGIQREQDAE